MSPSFLCSVLWSVGRHQVIALKALFSTYFTLSLLLNLSGRWGVETHFTQYTPYEFIHHCGPLRRCYVRAKQKSLLGSFSGFNKVPLLQTLEAVCEHAALWLHSCHITGGKTSHNKAMWDKCHAALTGYAIPTRIIKSYSHHKDWFKYYSKT